LYSSWFAPSYKTLLLSISGEIEYLIAKEDNFQFYLVKAILMFSNKTSITNQTDVVLLKSQSSFTIESAVYANLTETGSSTFLRLQESKADIANLTVTNISQPNPLIEIYSENEVSISDSYIFDSHHPLLDVIQSTLQVDGLRVEGVTANEFLIQSVTSTVQIKNSNFTNITLEGDSNSRVIIHEKGDLTLKGVNANKFNRGFVEAIQANANVVGGFISNCTLEETVN